MIDLLVKYAQDKGLVTEPGFVPKKAKWGLSLHSTGGTPTILPLMPKVDGSKSEERAFVRCPDLSQPELKSLGGKGAHFLLASCDVVALYTAAEDGENEGIVAKHAFFVNLLREASAVMPELAVAADVLANEIYLEDIRAQLKKAKAKPADKITLRINDSFPIESAEWYDWWRGFRRALAAKRQPEAKSGEDADKMVCFASGELVVPAKTHPKISGLSDVGGIGMGSPLIGFDKDAFESYGLRQSSNAAMSEESTTAYRAALDHLLSHHSVKIAGTKIVHWFDRAIPYEDDPFDYLTPLPAQQEGAALERARKLLERIRTGDRDGAELGQSFYYALTLSGASGRVMVRDWMVGQFAELVESIERWFTDLQIVSYRGGKMAKEPGMERVITCLLPQRPEAQQYEDWIKPVISIRPQLWAAATQQQPIPYGAVGRIMTQHLRFVQTGKLEQAEEQKQNVGLAVSLLQTRMALLKAYHCRNRKDIHMKSGLNEEYPDAAYHYGRLVAVYARLQRRALGRVGAGVVQRFYAAASATPGLVLSRLDRTAQHHLAALRSQRLCDEYENMLVGIWNQIRVTPPSQEQTQNPFGQSGIQPIVGIQKTLKLEEQTLFALGYYHQLPEVQQMEARFFKVSDNTEKDETDAEDIDGEDETEENEYE